MVTIRRLAAPPTVYQQLAPKIKLDAPRSISAPIAFPIVPQSLSARLRFRCGGLNGWPFWPSAAQNPTKHQARFLQTNIEALFWSRLKYFNLNLKHNTL
jgi:hypothetical protein